MLTQVGYPLANGCDSLQYCASADRLVLLATSSVSQSEHEEVGDLFFLSETTEGRGLAMVGAEVFPDTEDLVLSFVGLAGVGSSGELQRSAEIILEESSAGTVSSFQGLGCG